MIKKIRKRFENRKESEKGLTDLLVDIFLALVVLALLYNVIDVGVFHMNRNLVEQAVASGARDVAILGGTADNAISRQYTGLNMSSGGCGANTAGSVRTNNLIECSIYRRLGGGAGGDPRRNLTAVVRVQSITCGPTTTQRVGDRVWCQVVWRYNGINNIGFRIGGRTVALEMFPLRNRDVTTRASGLSEVVAR